MTAYHTRRQRQAGVALLVAMFALLLLSAIGMGMMFSANTETNVNMNYREKQLAVYAALAGAMEAKDRLTTAGDIPNPAGPPITSSANIVYIINPSGGETIAPWDYNNTYYDTELCQENILGLTSPGIGTQCAKAATSFPSGTAWYQTLDDSSSSYTGAFKLTTPLSYKWVRIQLKTNNATPYPVDGTASNSVQVCWNGLNQIPLPSGYSSACIPNGGINSIAITANGSGYSGPQVSISAPPAGGTQATATAQVCGTSGCPLSSITQTSVGSGYNSVPTVTVSTPQVGTDTAVVTPTYVGPGAALASVTQNNVGSPPACYSDANLISANWSPGGVTGKITFTGGGGSGGYATLNTVANYNCIYSLAIDTGSCTNKGQATTITIGSGNTFKATATSTITGTKSLVGQTVTVNDPGSTYSYTGSATQPITSGISATNGCTITKVTATMGHTLQAAPNGVTFNTANGGGGYTTSLSADTSTGSALSVTPACCGATPSITATPASGGSSTGTVTLTLTHAGSGYTSVPTITVTGGCGTGSPPPACPTTAAATAVINSPITSISITNAGSGYTSPPAVTITDQGAGTGALATASISGGTYYAPVYLLTALGISPAGARSMVQIEAAPAIRALNLPGALTLAGPQPTFGAPNSNNFNISGVDNTSGGGGTAPTPSGCSSTANASHPSIGVYDNPSAPTSPSSVTNVLNSIPAGRAGTNYPGLTASPDVQNVYGALGDQGTTPTGLDSIVSAISALPGANVYTGAQTDSTINLGSSNGATPPVITPAIDVVYGDLTFNGNTSGYGILVVTGNLVFKGNFTWNGIVLVIGQGSASFSGGGAGTINGSVLIAKTKDSSGNELSAVGQPSLNWAGGGGNGIYYDHCYADQYLSMIPMTVPASAKPLTILSIKTLSY